MSAVYPFAAEASGHFRTLKQAVPGRKQAALTAAAGYALSAGKVPGRLGRRWANCLRARVGLPRQRRPKDRTRALEYYFCYLEDDDGEVAEDAYLEFAKAREQEIISVAKRVSPEKLRRLLQNPQTPAYRRGMYASLLGHCGADKDGEFFRRLIEDRLRRSDGTIDGMLIGYTMLEPKRGWALTRAIRTDPSK